MLQVSIQPLRPDPTADCALTMTEVPPGKARVSVPTNRVAAITLVPADGSRSRSRQQPLAKGTYSLTAEVAGAVALELSSTDAGPRFCL